MRLVLQDPIRQTIPTNEACQQATGHKDAAVREETMDRRCPVCKEPSDQTAFCNSSNRFDKDCTRADIHVHHICWTCKIDWVEPVERLIESFKENWPMIREFHRRLKEE